MRIPRTPVDQSSHCRTLSVGAEARNLRAIRAFVEEVAASARLDVDRGYDLKVAVSEACANAVEHSGSEHRPLQVCATTYTDRLVIEIANGAHFRVNPAGGGPPVERGLGLPLMVAMVDEVRFVNTPDRGTLVRLTMLLDPTLRPPAGMHPPSSGRAR
jgi:serine/threonine-protein kinase RsbW